MSKILYTSDTHFGHANILKYCNRPWSTIAEHDQALINNWNQVVTPGDTIFHLGDFALSTPAYTARILQTLNGKKILIKGNHDRSLAKMKELGFDEVYNDYNVEGWYLQHKPNEAKKMLCGHVHTAWARRGWCINVGVDVRNFKPVTIEELLTV